MSLSPPHAPMVHASPLAVGTTFTFDVPLARSLFFRKINPSEAFTVVDDRGKFFRASLQILGDAGGEALVYEEMSGSTESPARITLVCAVLARQRMITVVQKATELGCVRIMPVLSDHSVKPTDLAKEKPWAWEGQAQKASRQCRRASVPDVPKTVSLAEAMTSAHWKNATRVFFLDDRSPAAASPLASLAASGDYVLAVGPEGGWSDPERARLVKAGAISLRMGARVLRAETAVFSGLTLLQHRLGDLAPSL